MQFKHLLSILAVLLLTQCTTETPESTTDQPTTTEAVDNRTDVHSYSHPDQAKTKHLNLNLVVDFDKKQLSGFAQWTIENNNANQVIFDIRDLNIEKVTIGKEEKETTFKVADPQEFLGAALTVDIQPTTTLVTIYYSTTPDGAAAVDWLDPQQTADKQHPFMFTQGQAILTRTWIPCQDSPGIRITYDATIKTDPNLLAVMSASNPTEKNEAGVYSFKMAQPIPPYLLALAVGDIVFEAIGDDTGIYAEPSMIKASVNEFADMQKMLEAAEELYGEYKWERYDVIVLPPSFPFGGMENPRLTFATPTIIAGDRSLTSLIAHELAHSWSGNLVTNATWDDFWLNEGFTVYFERRIMEALYGEDYANMLAMLGYQDLENTVNDLGHDHEDTHLHLNLKDRDPDDGMTDIAYEKGAYFLMMLEEKVGREAFDIFLKNYFQTHAFQTLTTTEFIDYLNKNLIEPNQVQVDLDEWIYGAGIPDNAPKPSSDAFAKVEAEANDFINNAKAPQRLKTDKWTTHEWLHFIRFLPKDLSEKQMKQLDKAFTLANSGNSEIKFAWYELSIRNGYSKNIMPQIEGFLVSVGRRKFLTPLYRAFKETEQLEKGREIYAKARPNYHSVSRQTMDALLEVKGQHQG